MMLPTTKRPVRFRYSHWWLKNIQRWTKGMTLGHTVIFKYPKEEISYEVHVHEMFHIRQVEELGSVKFYTKYLWLLMRYGYRAHPLELEVIAKTNNWIRNEGAGVEAECQHEWADARNNVISSGEWCRKCSLVRAGNEATSGSANEGQK